MGGAVWIGREATTAAVCDGNGWLGPAGSSLPLKSCLSASVEGLFPADGGRCYTFSVRFVVVSVGRRPRPPRSKAAAVLHLVQTPALHWL